mmetsp:Transcript_7085/g.21796  ORF Transcript_7085/g.21796 Transcript_7085/m.21796 type:complete len:98 (-) Transcript_7085:2118-2411(-)
MIATFTTALSPSPSRLGFGHTLALTGIAEAETGLPIVEHGAVRVGPGQPPSPRFTLASKRRGVPNNDQPTPRAGERDIGATRVRQEPATSRIVGANT